MQTEKDKCYITYEEYTKRLKTMDKKICPILTLAASIEGLKPMQRTGDEEIAECRKEKCAWWNINKQCAIYTGLMAIEQMFGKMI